MHGSEEQHLVFHHTFFLSCVRVPALRWQEHTHASAHECNSQATYSRCVAWTVVTHHCMCITAAAHMLTVPVHIYAHEHSVKCWYQPASDRVMCACALGCTHLVDSPSGHARRETQTRETLYVWGAHLFSATRHCEFSKRTLRPPSGHARRETCASLGGTQLRLGAKQLSCGPAVRRCPGPTVRRPGGVRVCTGPGANVRAESVRGKCPGGQKVSAVVRGAASVRARPGRHTWAGKCLRGMSTWPAL